VVPSHERPLRLRWLLNALEEQTLPRERWELVVTHDCAGDETEQLVTEHPLARDGLLRHRRLPAGTGDPGRQRNIGWREARAPLIAFTDDDCRPEADWLERLLAAAASHPGAIVQGRTRPDPFETDILVATHARTIEVDPPGPFAQTCNILYPRALLEAVGGFEDSFRFLAGEDSELFERCIERGAQYVGAPDAVVNHAVESSTLLGAVRRGMRWQHLAYVVKRHPHVRERLELGIFWRRSHLLLAIALAGVPLARRAPAVTALSALPYVRNALGRHGSNPRARVRAVTELPGRLVIDAAEMGTLARGSVRHRTLFL
jgi:glycosyltransferase involved in cell wall biosynthesis